jgi:hypothetical protein
MRVRFRSVVVGGLATTLLLSLIAAAPATAGSPTKAALLEHQRIVDFWTKDRIAQARPRTMALGGAGRFVPARKPAPTPSTPATTGSQWPDGAGVVYGATGRILFGMGGLYWICSGTVLTEAAADRSIVLTAGHCAYDQANDVFATEWMFIPEFDSGPVLFDCPSTPHGCWTASSLVVSAGFANAGGFDATAAQSDWAFAVLETGGTGGTALDETVGSLPIGFSPVKSGTPVTALGYPASEPYDGTELIYCHGRLGFDPLLLNRTYRLPCTMTGGSSGGPWLRGLATTGDGGTVASLNSYTYGGIAAMHGPKFGSRTQAAWAAALTTPTSQIVP